MFKNFKYFAIIVGIGSISIANGIAGEDVSIGEKIFQSNCASCHLKTGKGSPMMAKIFKVDVAAMDLTSTQVASMKIPDIIEIVTKGKAGKMPTFEGKLKKSDIAKVVSYIHSLGNSSLKKKTLGTSVTESRK